MKRVLVTLAVAAAAVFSSASANATTIEYTATSLGGDEWLYEYSLGDSVFSEGQGFTLFFDETLYSALELEAPAPGDPDWDPLVVQPDLALTSDGYYDLLSLVNNPSLDGPFSVSFHWLGPDAPGSQPFEIYQLEQELPRTIERGQTQTVPEPSTLLLLATGAGGAWLKRRRSR